MRVCVIGSGGREYTIAKRIYKDRPDIDLHCLPGNDAMTFAKINKDIKATDLDAIVEYCKKEAIDHCVVTPDDPLVLGLVDRLEKEGINCFGPKQKAAMLEGSKSFAKDFMVRHDIPTAKYVEFTDLTEARAYIKGQKYPLVIKADGLALGKGVVIAEDEDQADKTLIDFIQDHKFGKSSSKVVIEEFLEGPEISVLSFCDGKTIIPMISSMDHKKAYDCDQGPNTGGMGCIAPNPVFTKAVEKEFIEKIMEPTLKGLQEDDLDFRGCLYFGLMLTKNGLKVIEYNARFGDPETQVVIPLLKGDLLDIFIATTEQRLAETNVEFKSDHAACVVMAAEGYPIDPIKGHEISYPKDIEDLIVFAGIKMNERGTFDSNGGRVLNVLGFGKDLAEAIKDSYENVAKIHFDHCHYRKDIGKRALRIGEINDL